MQMTATTAVPSHATSLAQLALRMCQRTATALLKAFSSTRQSLQWMQQGGTLLLQVGSCRREIITCSFLLLLQQLLLLLAGAGTSAAAVPAQQTNNLSQTDIRLIGACVACKGCLLGADDNLLYAYACRLGAQLW
jgi:hypothetical protein